MDLSPHSIVSDDVMIRERFHSLPECGNLILICIVSFRSILLILMCLRVLNKFIVKPCVHYSFMANTIVPYCCLVMRWKFANDEFSSTLTACKKPNMNRKKWRKNSSKIVWCSLNFIFYYWINEVAIHKNACFTFTSILFSSYSMCHFGSSIALDTCDSEILEILE